MNTAEYIAVSGNFAYIASYTADTLTVVDVSGPSCTNPARAEGTLLYNSSSKVMQYCDGASWVAVGKAPPNPSCPGTPGPGDEGCVAPDGSLFAGDTNMYVTDMNQGALIQWKATTGNDDINPDSLTDGAANHANVTVPIANLPAINLCETLDRHGHQDWYLPAKDELNVLYTNKAAIDTNAMENFTTGFYWSSTENNGSNSWLQRVSDGNQRSESKNLTRDVRCVRRGP